jgi:hypothetical protein
MVCNHLQYTGIAKSAQRLYARMPAAFLSLEQRLADMILHVLGKAGNIALRLPDPEDGFYIVQIMLNLA